MEVLHAIGLDFINTVSWAYAASGFGVVQEM